MIRMVKIETLIMLMILLTQVQWSWAQNGSQKYIGDRLEDFTDSLKNAKYPFRFPIWGDKVMEKGFDIPLPHGIMVNTIKSRQNVLLENMQLAINGGDLVDVSDYVRFRSVEVDANTTNARIDTWILPFLNAYGIFGYIESDTEVNVGLPIDLTANSNNDGLYYGLGIMAAGGFGPVWVSFDYNQVWVNLALLDKATRARVNGLRVGHTIVFKKRPQQNVAFWIGGQFQKLASVTSGSVNLSEVISLAPEKAAELNAELTEWFEGLSPLAQEVLQPVVDGLGDHFENREGISVQYVFEKKLANPASLAVGGQWQINKVWQLRGEFNTLGSRTQGMFSVNFRFGIKGRNIVDRVTK